MIALTSIPFSFSVFWRFLVVLPIFVPIAFAVVLTYSLILPGLSGVLLSVATAFATLMAICGGFQARGVSGVSVFSKLLVSSIKWGLLEGLLYAAIGIGMAFALSAASPLGVPLLRGLVRNPDPHAVWLFLTSSPRVMAVMLVGLGLIYGLSVAFSVPKAAAAYSAGEKARPLDFFWGFGAGFFSLAVVMVAASAIALLSESVRGSVELVAYGFGHVVAWLTEARPPEIPAADLVRLAGLTLLNIWTYCWFSAASALAFLRRLERIEAARSSERAVPQPHAIDLRTLRKSRE